MIELLIISLAFIQNMSFTMVSRARNRDNMWYHAICSVFSNGIWLACFGILGVEFFLEQNFWVAIPYIIGTVSGSLFGAKTAIWVEKKIGAKT